METGKIVSARLGDRLLERRDAVEIHWRQENAPECP